MFDRLLWPQRYFHHPAASDAVKLAFFLSVAGPLHGAALAALDRFLNHGLYLGRQLGDMLGTALFDEKDVRYPISGRRGQRRDGPSRGRSATDFGFMC